MTSHIDGGKMLAPRERANMKQRLVDVLAWGAFLWGVVTIFRIFSTAGWVLAGLELSVFVSPVIWAVLHVMTGNARLLPWLEIGSTRAQMTIVLSWWAFLHALLICTGLLNALGGKVRDVSWIEPYFEPFANVGITFFGVAYGAVIVGFGFSPAIWLLLYFWHGNPLIFPWRKLQHDG